MLSIWPSIDYAAADFALAAVERLVLWFIALAILEGMVSGSGTMHGPDTGYSRFSIGYATELGVVQPHALSIAAQPHALHGEC